MQKRERDNDQKEEEEEAVPAPAGTQEKKNKPSSKGMLYGEAGTKPGCLVWSARGCLCFDVVPPHGSASLDSEALLGSRFPD